MKRSNKLSLRKETIRSLDHHQLAAVHGGGLWTDAKAIVRAAYRAVTDAVTPDPKPDEGGSASGGIR